MRIAVDDLIPNPVQPPARTREKATREIVHAMADSHLVAPLVVTRYKGKFMVVDGHRRLAAAQEHGRSTVPCLVVDVKEPEMTFCYLGRGVRGVGGVDWFAVWARSDADRREGLLKSIPEGGAKNIEEMIEIFSERRAIELASTGDMSPHMCRWINIAAKAVRQYFDPLPLRQTGEWVIKHKMASSMHRMEREGKVTRKRALRLRDCILKDKPFTVNGRLRETPTRLRRVS